MNTFKLIHYRPNLARSYPFSAAALGASDGLWSLEELASLRIGWLNDLLITKWEHYISIGGLG